MSIFLSILFFEDDCYNSSHLRSTFEGRAISIYLANLLYHCKPKSETFFKISMFFYTVKPRPYFFLFTFRDSYSSILYSDGICKKSHVYFPIFFIVLYSISNEISEKYFEMLGVSKKSYIFSLDGKSYIFLPHFWKVFFCNFRDDFYKITIFKILFFRDF